MLAGRRRAAKLRRLRVLENERHAFHHARMLVHGQGGSEAAEEAARIATEERLAAAMERLANTEQSLEAARIENENKLAEHRLAAEQAILEQTVR
eukprot:COSAG06_NODE_36952_length_441_cov_0.733918_1_plen_94_part_10